MATTGLIQIQIQLIGHASCQIQVTVLDINLLINSMVCIFG